MAKEKFNIQIGDEYAKLVAKFDIQKDGIDDKLLEALERLKEVEIEGEQKHLFWGENEDKLGLLETSRIAKVNEYTVERHAPPLMLSKFEERLEKQDSKWQDRQKLVGILKAVGELTNGTPTGEYLKDNDLGCRMTYQEYFGHMNNALIMAGFEPNRKEYGKDIIEHIGRERLYETGKAPTAGELHESEYAVTKSKIRDKCDSLNDFLEDSGLKTDYLARMKMLRDVYEEDYFDESVEIDKSETQSKAGSDD
ncbi:MAG: hypothetical protein H8Z69_00770 [Nanohaloarchaea archaeon]|nr:hypothetical protein [Candidatus Nanohaloarchaea archaeon]